jgi:hypothetical protein
MSGWRVLGRVIAVFIIMAFVAGVPILLLTYNAIDAAVNPDFLDPLFTDRAFFEGLIPEMAQDMAREVRRSPETRDTLLARLNTADWEQVLRTALPPEQMQQWAQDAKAALRDELRRGNGPLFGDVILPFGTVLDNIVQDPDNTVLRTILQAQPLCAAGEDPLGGEFDLLPQCRPESIDPFVQNLAARWREEPREVWRQLMPAELKPYTANITLNDFISTQSGEDWSVRVGWRAGRWGANAVRLFFGLCFGAQCLVGLILVGLLAARNGRELLRWFGTPLALAGALTLALALFLFTAGEFGLGFAWWEGTTTAVRQAFQDTGAAFARALWQPMLWQGGALLLIGVGLWAISFAVPAPRRPAPAPEQDELTTGPEEEGQPEQLAPREEDQPAAPQASAGDAEAEDAEDTDQRSSPEE